LPPNDYEHQALSDDLSTALRAKRKRASFRVATSAVGVCLPPLSSEETSLHIRVPDIVVSRKTPVRRYQIGEPPDLVIEILSTRRGNVERTEKLDDYARAGIPKYWVVNPFDRAVETYCLRDGEYELFETARGLVRSRVLPGLEVDMDEIWAAF